MSTRHPGLKEKRAFKKLVDICCLHDGISLSLPQERDVKTLYIRDSSAPGLRVLAVAAFAPAGDGSYLCSAFTEPAWRKRGLFKTLLREWRLIEKSRGGNNGAPVIFYADPGCHCAAAALEKLGARLSSKEYMMELPAESLNPAQDNLSAGISKSMAKDGLSVREARSGTHRVLAYATGYGRLFVMARRDSYFIYGLEIAKGMRGKGHGTALLGMALSDIAARGQKPVRLHVPGDNKPAVALYKKAGFEIAQSLGRYVLAPD